MTGSELRDEGIRRAEGHAERVEPGWLEHAVEYVRDYARLHPELTSEKARQYAERCGLPEPPDKRSWGGVMLRALRAGVVEKIGWTTADDPLVHNNPVSLWRSRVYR